MKKLILLGLTLIVGLTFGQYKQSLYSNYPKLVFSDVMNDEYGTRFKGGVPTAITYTYGKASFNGTTSNITYRPLVIKTIRFKVKLNTTTQPIITLSATHSISVTSGTISATGFSSPTIYVNGVISSTITTTETWVAITDTLFIKANAIVLGKVSTSYLSGTIDEIQFFNDTKTAQNIVDMQTSKYAKDNAIVPDTIFPSASFKIAKSKTNFVTTPASSIAEPNLVFAYTGNTPTQGKIIDASGNGNNGTLYGGTIYTGGLQFDGVNDYVSVADANSLDFGTGDFTVEALINLKSTVISQRILSKRIGTDFFELYISPDSPYGWKFVATSSGGSGAVGTLSVPSLGLQLVTVTRTSSLLSIYVNGTLINTAASNVGSISNANALGIGHSTAGGGFLNGIVYSAKLYNVALTSQQVKDKWNKLANKPYILEDFSDGTVGKFPRDWTKGTGTYTVQQLSTAEGFLKAGTKYLRNDVAGTIAFKSDEAYGVWEFDFYKGADANRYEINFHADRIGASQNQQGYYFVNTSTEVIALSRSNIASVTSLMATPSSYTATHGVWYRIKVTRNTNGQLNLYIKDDSFGSSYILVSVSSGTNPATDNTYSTSKWFVLDLDANDRFTNLKMYRGIPVQ